MSVKMERLVNVLSIHALASQPVIMPNGQCASGIVSASLAPGWLVLNMDAQKVSRNAMPVVLDMANAVSVAKK